MNTSFPELDTHRLAGLVFELASQLHAERLHRLALEAALAQKGVIHPDAVAALADDPSLRERGRLAVEDSVARLLRIVTDADAMRAPEGD